MGTVKTWRDHPTAPPDEPTRRCGVKCEHWHQDPACPMSGFCDLPDVFEHTPIGTECWR